MTPDGEIDLPLWKRDNERFVGELKFHEYSSTDDSRQGSYGDLFPPYLLSVARCLHKLSFGVYVLLLVYAELEYSAIDGVSQLLPASVSSYPYQYLVLGAVLIVVLLLIVSFGLLLANSSQDSVETIRRLVGPIGFYFGLGVLLTGAIISVGIVALEQPQNSNVVHTSGFFCLLYIGGPLTYDGMLRTERLFTNVRRLDIVHPDFHVPDRLEEFRSDGERSLKKIVILVMSVLFVLPFAWIWSIETGPFNTGSPLLIVLDFLFDVLIVALAIHFLLLVHVMYSLFTSSDEDQPRFVYKALHPDRAAGFRDFGRFATRVNVLLILGALYLVYRLYVQGRLAFFVTDQQFTLTAIDPLWMINYLLPVIAYLAVVFVWFYYSFFIIHRVMRRAQKRRLEEIRTYDYESTEQYNEWQAIRSGPVWPINDRLLIALLSADLVSLGVAFVALFG